MTIVQREVEGIQILELCGKLIGGPDSTLLRDRVTELVTSDQNKLVLNLKQIDAIDSTGLGTLVICYTALQKQGGALKLTNLSRRNLNLLVLTKLSTVFEIFEDEQDAVNSFFPNRAIKRFDILDYVKSQPSS